MREALARQQRQDKRPWQAAMAAAGLLAALAFSSAAHAELYGFIDEQGVAHFASEKQDERYQLFVKDGGALEDINPRRQSATDAQVDLTRHKLYRYIVNHPNIPKVEPLIRQIAEAQNVDPALVKAVMAVESGFNPGAVSDKGAIGLMQVIPDTGARFGVTADARRSVEQKLADPRTNISAGVRYLRWLMALYPGNLELVLAAYNAGEGAVQRYNNRIPPFPETQQYVTTVMQFYRLYGAGGMMLTGGNGQRVRMVIGGRRQMP
jgi:soluble lytic murein transglycosylase-like protein